MTPTLTPRPRIETGPAAIPFLKRRGLRVPSRLFVALLLVLGASAGELQAPIPENVFAASWTAWARLRQRDLATNTTGADTIIMWKVVKSRFKSLDKSLNYK